MRNESNDGGISCPLCGAIASTVVDTRNKDDYVRRRRECPNGHRLTTKEMSIDGRNYGHLHASTKHALRRRVEEVMAP